MENRVKNNYHTHTYLCHHAEGTMRETVEAAIGAGMETLGFSCHTPYPFPDGYYSGFRMTPDEQKTYVDAILELREEFSDKIKLLIGYEAEYYPRHFNDLLKMLNRYPCDYIILGQHSINNEYDGGYFVACPTDDIGIIEKYVDQVCEAMRFGVYSYVAHPDIATYTGDMSLYLEKMKKICEVSVETDTPLEINMLGIRESRHYPKDEFLALAGEFGCKMILGCDAHAPSALDRPTTYKRAMELAEKYSLNVIEELPLKRPSL